MRNLSVLFLVITVSGTSFCGPWWHDMWAKEDTSCLAWLELPIGARAISLGGAYIAASEDPTSNLLNPSNIVRGNDWQASFSHTQHFLGIRQEFLGASLKRGNNAFGVTFSGVFTDGLELRSETQDLIGEFSAFGYVAGVTYARKLSEEFDMGIGLKSIFEQIYIYDVKTWAVDAGLNYTVVKGLRLGAAINNFGPGINTPDSLSWKLPFGWKIGVGCGIDKLLVSLEINKYVDRHLQSNIGLEYKLTSILSLRAGYIPGSETEGFSAGFGLNVKGLQVDYAFKPYNLGLNPAHIFTITL